jgi:hypothetical protein
MRGVGDGVGIDQAAAKTIVSLLSDEHPVFHFQSMAGYVPEPPLAGWLRALLLPDH